MNERDKNNNFFLNRSNIKQKKIVGILELFSKYKFPKTKKIEKI